MFMVNSFSASFECKYQNFNLYYDTAISVNIKKIPTLYFKMDR